MTDKSDNSRIGVYGGTFDPIHNGHVEIARAVIRNFRLDSLLFVPAAAPPHKDSALITSSHHRYAMAVLASSDIDGARVSLLEIEAPGRPYTYQTVQRLKSLNGPRSSLFLIVGSDSFEQLHTWWQCEPLVSAVRLIVASRPGARVASPLIDGDRRTRMVDLRGGRQPDSSGDADGVIYLTDYVSVDISSSDIRKRLARGESIDRLVPASVAAYIGRYEPYGVAEPGT